MMPSWLPIVASLIGGGACGAVLKVAYDHWRDRRQPVSYRVSTDSVFTSAPHAGNLQANAQVTYDGQTYPFDSLSLVRIEIKNKGNRDLNTFAFGITLGGGHQAVLCVSDGDDRHHQIRELEPKATPANPRDTIDLTCTPFNRTDHYTVRLYVRNSGDVNTEQVKLSTAIPIRFTQVQSVDDQSAITFYSSVYGAINAALMVIALLAMLMWTLELLPWRQQHVTVDGVRYVIPEYPSGDRSRPPSPEVESGKEGDRNETPPRSPAD